MRFRSQLVDVLPPKTNPNRLCEAFPAPLDTSWALLEAILLDFGGVLGSRPGKKAAQLGWLLAAPGRLLADPAILCGSGANPEFQTSKRCGSGDGDMYEHPCLCTKTPAPRRVPVQRFIIHVFKYCGRCGNVNNRKAQTHPHPPDTCNISMISNFCF